MASLNVDSIWNAIRALSDAERDELRHLLALDSKQSGELQTRPPLATPPVAISVSPPIQRLSMTRFRAWRPVVVNGKPVSETIIEERR